MKVGGLALADPVKAAGRAVCVSKEATEVLQEAVRSGEDVDVVAHHARCTVVLKAVAGQRKADHATSYE